MLVASSCYNFFAFTHRHGALHCLYREHFNTLVSTRSFSNAKLWQPVTPDMHGLMVVSFSQAKTQMHASGRLKRQADIIMKFLYQSLGNLDV